MRDDRPSGWDDRSLCSLGRGMRDERTRDDRSLRSLGRGTRDEEMRERDEDTECA